MRILQRIRAGLLPAVLVLAGCAAADTRDAPGWGDDAAGGAVDDGGGAAPTAANAAAGPCQPGGMNRFACRCADAQRPDWLLRAGQPAWRQGGFVWTVAVTEGEPGRDRRLGLEMTFHRAAIAIAALETGAAPGQPVRARLAGVESRAGHVADDGRIYVLARHRPGGWGLGPDYFKARCPEPPQALVDCDCGPEQRPAWTLRVAWVGDDGFAYAAAGAPLDGPRPASRALNRARANLGRLLQGMRLVAETRPDGARIRRSLSVSDLDSDRIQQLMTREQDGQRLQLVRIWVGAPRGPQP